MTTFFDFAPTSVAPFQFQPTLDGTIYSAIVTWNLFGQRYYLNLYDLSGNLVVSLPVIGSPAGIAIEGASWLRGEATLGLADPHGLRIGSTAVLTVSGMTPDAYNGTFEALVVSVNQVTYSLASDPGAPSVLGYAGKNVDLVAGYFSSSTLIYREGANRFEVSP